MEITFEQLPKVVTQLYDKLENIERMLLDRSNETKPEADELLTVQDTAKFLTLSIPTVYGLVSRSEIPSMKKGKRLYFSKTELTDWIKASRKKTVSELAVEADTFLSNQKKRGLK